MLLFYSIFSLYLLLLWLKLLHLWHFCFLMHHPQLWILKWLPSPCASSSSFGSAWYCSATTTDTKGHDEQCCWPCQCATAATSVPDTFSVSCQLCHMPSSGDFSFSELSLPLIFSWMYLLWCLLSAFRFQCGCKFTNRGLTVGSCTTPILQSIPMAGICAS